jgi:peptidoglycan/xylan/chitin deacetylase (PgdA/CDA1 family)
MTSGWRRPAARFPAVLAYHKVGTPEWGGTWCTRAGFARHLDAVQQAGIGWTTLDTLAGWLRAPSGAPPDAVLTFDDAFASFATHAWPEIEARHVPVVLFVPSDCIGRTSRWDLPLPGRRVPHLDAPALRDLAGAGVEIGAHGATHRDLRSCPDFELEHELAGARARLQDELGVPVRAVSYPFGRADARVRAAARAAGYQFGFTMAPGGRATSVDPLAIPRRGVYCIDGAGAVLDKIDPRRRGHGWQLLQGRAISAVAGVAAWKSRVQSAG